MLHTRGLFTVVSRNTTMRLRCTHTTFRILVFFVLMGLVYYSPTRFGGNMQNPVVALAASLVERRQLDIDGCERISVDLASRGGHTYSGMAPGLSWLAVPVYAVARTAWRLVPGPVQQRLAQRLARKPPPAYSILRAPHAPEMILTHLLMNVIFGSLAGALGFVLLRRVLIHLGSPPSEALLGAAGASFATVMAFYQVTYYTQSVAAVLLLLGLYVLWVRSVTPANWLAGGFCCALAGAVDYPFFIYGGTLAGMALVRMRMLKAPWRAALSLAAGFAIPLALTLLYHAACFGSPFAVPYAFRLNNAGMIDHRAGLAGVRLPSNERFFALLFSPREGVITLMPILALVPFGVWGLIRKADRETRWLVTTMLLIALLAAGYFVSIPWNSDTAAYGPRFFLAAVPMLAALALPRTRRLLPVYLGLAAYGLLVNHFRVLGYPLPPAVADLLAGRSLVPPRLQFCLPTTPLPLIPGLLYDAALLAVLSGSCFLRLERRPCPRN